MTDLPTGWEATTIGTVTLRFESGAPRIEPDNTFSYIDISSIDNSRQVIATPKILLGRDAPSRARRIVETGDILFSTVRTYLKNIAMVPPNFDGAYTSTGIAVLRPSGAIHPRYLFHWVCSTPFIEAMSKAEDGTLYPAVTDSDVASGNVPLPPLAEQRRIVAKLDALSARTARARADLDRIPALAARYKQAVLAEAFCGRLTADIGNPLPSHDEGSLDLLDLELDGSERGEWRETVLPDGWEWRGFDEVFEDVTDSKRKLPTKDYSEAGAYPIIDQGDVFMPGYTDRADMVHPAPPPYIVFGDHTRCVKFIDVPFVQGADGVKVLRPRTGVHPRYAELLLRGINLPDKGYSRHAKFLRASYFPLCGHAEQAEVVRRLDSAFAEIDRLATEAAAARRLLDRLDQAILAKAFRGELVPQDPADEPASVLLARIKAARAAAPTGARRGRKAKAA